MNVNVKKIPVEKLLPHVRPLAIMAAVTVAALAVIPFVPKIKYLYPLLKQAVLGAAGIWTLLYAVKHSPWTRSAHRYVKYAVLSIIGAALAIFVFLIAWYAFCFFPDDQAYLERVARSVSYAGNHREEVELDLVRALGRAAVENPLTEADRRFLLSSDLMEKEFYIHENPYAESAHPNNLKYATGRIFYYTSQKNCLVFRPGTKMSFQVNGTSARSRFLEFSAAFPAFSKTDRAGIVQVYFYDGQRKLIGSTRVARERRPDIRPFRYSSVLSSIRFYLGHPGRSVLPSYTGWDDVKVELPRRAGRVDIEFHADNEPGNYLFLGSPRIVGAHDAGRGGHLNIVYLIFDTLSRQHVDLYRYYEMFARDTVDNVTRQLGNRKVVTPNIDRYASRILLLDNMYSVGQVTRPAIVPLWTSKPYTKSRMPVFRNIVTPDNAREYYGLRHPSLPDELSKAGYFTKQISCNAQGHGVSGVGVDLGFDENYDYTMEASEHPENIRRIIEFLNENQNRKFLLYAHINIPHPPRWIPLGYYLKALWDSDFNHDTAVMLGNVRYLDDCFGKIMRAAESLRLGDNTMFVITADHSSGLSSKFRGDISADEVRQAGRESQSVAWFHGRSIYVRKGSVDLYRNTVNIPWIAILPARSAMLPGRAASTVSALDIAPTFLDMAAGRRCAEFEGKSFKQVFYGEDRNKVLSADIPLIGRFQQAMLFDGRYKYWQNLPGLYKYRESGGKKYIMQQEYLFDLKDDPGETRNLALDGRAPQLLGAMRKRFTARYVDYPDKNFVQIAPVKSAGGADYRFVVQSSGRIIHPRTYGDFITSKSMGDRSIEFSAKVHGKYGFFSFETDPSSSPVSITVYRDGRMLSRDRIYGAQECVNLYDNPVRLSSPDDFLLARVPGKTGLEEKALPEGSVYVYRVPLIYWLEMNRSDRDIKLSPGIKEVLRGWGYIQ